MGLIHKTFRRILSFCGALALFLRLSPAFAQGSDLSVSAKSAVLLSADTGEVLWEKDGDKRLSMASTTKIMTALLTLEEARRENDPVVDITEEMVRVEGSSMGLQAGDKISLSNLAAGMLLASGNDAANSAALFLDGSQEKFSERMNERAEELHMENTHFVTPSGLDDEEHYSTARDMALLAREAIKNEDFLKICSSSSMQVEFSQPAKKVTYTNHNKLLTWYEGCIGVKTGFTKKSGRCLVSAARRQGVTLIAVTLNAPDDWNDHMAMLDYGFSRLESVSFDGGDLTAEVPVVGSQAQTVAVRGGAGGSLAVEKGQAQKITRRVLLPAFLYAPIAEGEKVGKLTYYLDGTEIYSIPITAAGAAGYVEKEPGFWEKLFGG